MDPRGLALTDLAKRCSDLLVGRCYAAPGSELDRRGVATDSKDQQWGSQSTHHRSCQGRTRRSTARTDIRLPAADPTAKRRAPEAPGRQAPTPRLALKVPTHCLGQDRGERRPPRAAPKHYNWGRLVDRRPRGAARSRRICHDTG